MNETIVSLILRQLNGLVYGEVEAEVIGDDLNISITYRECNFETSISNFMFFRLR